LQKKFPSRSGAMTFDTRLAVFVVFAAGLAAADPETVDGLLKKRSDPDLSLAASPASAMVPGLLQPPGIDFAKLHFGKKNFGSTFILKFLSNFHPKRAGVDVVITIFCDFPQFSAKKLAFLSKTNVMIKILHNLALF
jgi:hypothetical protein